MNSINSLERKIELPTLVRNITWGAVVLLNKINIDTYYDQKRDSFEKKADHNKFESQLCFYTIITCTLTAPLFVTMGSGLILGKLIPAVLSTMAAATTAWIQLRKPQQLWSLYRRTQRELEREKTHFDFELGDYSSSSSAERLFAARISEIAYHTHEQWEGLVPQPDRVSSLIANDNKAVSVA